MKKTFAGDLERAITEELEQLKKRTPELTCLWDLLLVLQEEFIQVLQSNDPINLETGRLTGSDEAWKQVHAYIAGMEGAVLQRAVPLWTIYSLLERTAQYYHQAGINSAYPKEKAWYLSLEQIKLMEKRKVGGAVRTVHNHLWGQLGFAPFMIGKE